MELSLKDILSVLIAKWWLIITTTILGGIFSFIVSEYVIPPKYESDLSLYVFNADINNVNGSNYNDLIVAQKLVKTYIAALQTDKFLDSVIEDSEIDIDALELRKMIKMQDVLETELFKITVKSGSPSQSLRIANSIAKLAPRGVETIVQTGRTEIVDIPKMAKKPSSPNITLNTLIGIMVGFIISCGVVLLIYVLDTGIKSEEEIMSKYEISILGSIPIVEEGKKNAKKSVTTKYKSKNI